MRVDDNPNQVGAHGDVPLQKAQLAEALAVLVILLLATTLRLGWPGVNSFAFDEAHLSLIALNMAQEGAIARVGMPSSAGVPNLPAAAWVFSLPYLFSTDPLVATQFTGLLSSLMVAGVWWLARRVWGTWAGLVAALFLAASPYSVLYARNIWAQDLLPLLALAWGWTAFLAATRRNRLASGLHVFLAGVAFQVHFAGAALVIGTAYFFVRFRWWRHLLPLVIGGGLALLALLPFALEIACCRPDILEAYRAALGGSTQYDLSALMDTVRIGLGTGWGFLLLGDLHPSESPLLAIGIGLVLLAGLMELVRIIIRARRTPQPRADSAILAEIVIVWLLTAPLFFLRHSTPVFIHYALVALPALAVLAGASVSGLAPRNRLVGEGLRPRWPWISAIITLLVALAWSVQIGQSLSLAGQVGTPNGLGTPLNNTRAAAYELPDDAPVVFFTHGDDPNVDGEAAVFEVLWWGREHRIVSGGSLLILPSEPAWLMATLRPFQAWEEIEASGLASDVLTFPRREGLLPYVTTRYDGTTEPTGFTPLDEPVMLADGAQLEGWKARMVGPRLRISTLWRVMIPPGSGRYQQFHHLRTTATLDNEQPAHIADVAISAHDWRVGDRLIVMSDFFVDGTDDYWVDVGHYTLPALQRIPRADGTDGMIRLGPFRVES